MDNVSIYNFAMAIVLFYNQKVLFKCYSYFITEKACKKTVCCGKRFKLYIDI